MQLIIAIIVLPLAATSIALKGGKDELRYHRPNHANSLLHFDDEVAKRAAATPAECCEGNCASYRGFKMQSESGKNCMEWLHLPSHFRWTPAKQPGKDLRYSACRNPSDHTQAWCYVKIVNKKGIWENCDIPKCPPPTTPTTPKPTPPTVPTTPLTPRHRECCPDKNCNNYRGKLNVTKDGKKCQRWDSDSPTKRHGQIKAWVEMGEGGLTDNYCRQPYKPDQVKSTWCYTEDSKSGDDFQFCDTPWCRDVCCFEKQCKDYDGYLAVTIGGKQCQRWDKDYPHRRSSVVKKAERAGLLESNYCRNPTNARTVWCYTTDAKTKWDYCDVQWCDKDSCDLSECNREGGTCSRPLTGGTICTCKEGWKGKNCDQRFDDRP